MNDERVRESLGADLRASLSRWRELQLKFAGALQDQTYVIVDKQERCIERVDQPRVQGIPVLRYAPPRAVSENWTLFDQDVARRAALELDAKQVAFAPHRAMPLMELIAQRILAAEQGLQQLQQLVDSEIDPDELGDDDEGDAVRLRP
ncbi:hypothetical protein ACW0US_17640 [Xanthomonas euvesicatoria]